MSGEHHSCSVAILDLKLTQRLPDVTCTGSSNFSSLKSWCNNTAARKVRELQPIFLFRRERGVLCLNNSWHDLISFNSVTKPAQLSAEPTSPNSQHRIFGGRQKNLREMLESNPYTEFSSSPKSSYKLHAQLFEVHPTGT